MALWAKAQRLQGDALRQVLSMYGPHFPLEVRHYLADWLEARTWTELEPENPEHELQATKLVTSLIEELEKKVALLKTPEQFLIIMKLREALDTIKKTYQNNPCALIKIVRQTLATELKLVQEAEMSNPNGSCSGETPLTVIHAELMHKLEEIREKTNATYEEVHQLAQVQESLALIINELATLDATIQSVSSQPETPQTQEVKQRLLQHKESINQQITITLKKLLELRLNLVEQYKETVSGIAALQSRILEEELAKWKRNVQLAGNGAPFLTHLDTIQEWCENLVEVIWLNRHQMRELEHLRARLPVKLPNSLSDSLPTLISKVTELLHLLVANTFVVCEQPPQVMKTNIRFSASVRHLVGGKLNIHMAAPKVRVDIVNENQARKLHQLAMVQWQEFSGEILNNEGTLEYHQASKHLSVSFRNMQLRRIKRSEKDKKAADSIKDEKFALLFQTTFTLGDEKLFFPVFTLSLPVVVVVHVNQEAGAWATVSWHNAFSSPKLPPWAMPSQVPWPQVAEMLSMRFHYGLATHNHSLDHSQLHFLASKLFRTKMDDYNSVMVQWSHFCKDPLPNRNFTFWEWFYAVARLTREHLKEPWVDGRILGLIGRAETEELLLPCPHGTFLLRFSDSELGGVTVAWVAEDPMSAKREVFMLQPFTGKDFTIRSLADRISDLKYLMYLFPHIPKDEAFSKYYTLDEPNVASSNGYVKPNLVTQVPGWTELSTSQSSDSVPTTPQPTYTASPRLASGYEFSVVDLKDVLMADLDLSLDVVPDISKPS
ncbi:unnamed protein product [Darwinula stevensoni]|uniref:Signal transducer and activator of transcription n=1 Tax=Darwinula stevensoni TaxID=69355 RepID=A0A7R9AC70_9CRUS|nr:unnamed protein product [Darwinula stevensoni]CAG0900048.1 unnamed protein product [Darwinula stevensoni]